MRLKTIVVAALLTGGSLAAGGCGAAGGAGGMGGMGAALGPLGTIASVGSMMQQQKAADQQQQQSAQQQQAADAQQAAYQQRPAESMAMNLTGTLRSTRNAGGVVDGWLLAMDQGGVAYDLDVSDVLDEAKQLDGKKVVVVGSMKYDQASADQQHDGGPAKMPAVKATKLSAL